MGSDNKVLLTPCYFNNLVRQFSLDNNEVQAPEYFKFILIYSFKFWVWEKLWVRAFWVCLSKEDEEIFVSDNMDKTVVKSNQSHNQIKIH